MTDRIFRSGDRVTVWGEVTNYWDNVTVRLPTGSGGVTSIWFRPDQIDKHEPRAIAVGDWVTTKYSTAPVQVLFIHDQWAILPGIAAPWVARVDSLTPWEAP